MIRKKSGLRRYGILRKATFGRRAGQRHEKRLASIGVRTAYDFTQRSQDRASGLREGENPARWQGHLEHKLPAKNKVQKVEHFEALPYADIGAFMAGLRKYEGTEARALEFSILTTSRSNEVRLATWEEIDFSVRFCS